MRIFRNKYKEALLGLRADLRSAETEMNEPGRERPPTGDDYHDLVGDVNLALILADIRLVVAGSM